ncbi:uncharacterized protein LOC124245492 [Equus quagga]|uniref:uncharacterized protein LOC124245492 n=1 Tax=Equus quagga TaxID=89248 RepID=UPI001EE30401|nr:uncharacterized protein LOC124245492 [Equus quagga]
MSQESQDHVGFNRAMMELEAVDLGLLTVILWSQDNFILYSWDILDLQRIPQINTPISPGGGPKPPAGPGRGWAGRRRSAARRCAGRRERGGEDSSGLSGQRDGGRTCGLGGRLTHREEGKRGPPLLRSEETLGVQGSGRCHLLLQRRQHSQRAHWPQRQPSAQVGTPERGALPLLGPPRAGCPPFQATEFGGEGWAGLGVGGRCTAPWCARLCARAVLGGEEVRESSLPQDLLPRVSLSPPPLSSDQQSSRAALENCDPLPRPQSRWCVHFAPLFTIHTQQPSGRPLLCRNLGRRESGGKTSQGRRRRRVARGDLIFLDLLPVLKPNQAFEALK